MVFFIAGGGLAFRASTSCLSTPCIRARASVSLQKGVLHPFAWQKAVGFLHASQPSYKKKDYITEVI